MQRIVRSHPGLTERLGALAAVITCLLVLGGCSLPSNRVFQNGARLSFETGPLGAGLFYDRSTQGHRDLWLLLDPLPFRQPSPLPFPPFGYRGY